MKSVLLYFKIRVIILAQSICGDLVTAVGIQRSWKVVLITIAELGIDVVRIGKQRNADFLKNGSKN